MHDSTKLHTATTATPPPPTDAPPPPAETVNDDEYTALRASMSQLISQFSKVSDGQQQRRQEIDAVCAKHKVASVEELGQLVDKLNNDLSVFTTEVKSFIEASEKTLQELALVAPKPSTFAR